MPNRITDSQFHVWRTLCAIAHADNIFKDEELRFMAEALSEVELNTKQNETLKNDISNQKDYNAMFSGITEKRDRAEFFNFARGLVWADGEYVTEEKSAMLQLQKAHIDRTDVDSLIGSVPLEFEEDDNLDRGKTDKQSRFRHIIDMFKKHYFNKL